MSDERKNKVQEKIAGISLSYMKSNRDDFIKHWDILTTAIAEGSRSTMIVITNRKELMKDAKSNEEKIEIHNIEMNNRLRAFKKTLPKYACLLQDEIENAFEAGADAAMCAIASEIDGCEDCPEKDNCKAHAQSL